MFEDLSFKTHSLTPGGCRRQTLTTPVRNKLENGAPVTLKSSVASVLCKSHLTAGKHTCNGGDWIPGWQGPHSGPAIAQGKVDVDTSRDSRVKSAVRTGWTPSWRFMTQLDDPGLPPVPTMVRAKH